MKVRARHHLIQPAIGVHQREQESYDLVTSLLYSLPFALIVAAALDQCLVTLYMKSVHPWKAIVQDHPEEMTEEEAVDQAIVEDAMREAIPLVTLNLVQEETEETGDLNQPRIL